MTDKSTTLKVRNLNNGDTVELRQLSSDWLPWTHQVNRFVHNPERVALYSPGQASAGQPCCNSSSNFDDVGKADAYFSEAA